MSESSPALVLSDVVRDRIAAALTDKVGSRYSGRVEVRVSVEMNNGGLSSVQFAIEERERLR